VTRFVDFVASRVRHRAEARVRDREARLQN